LEYQVVLEKKKGVLRLFKKERSREHLGKKAVLLHGYGGKKEEMLFMGLFLVEKGFECLLFDLPGHGEREDFLEFSSVDNFLRGLKGEKFSLAIGHSLGARIALLLKAEFYVLLSPPLTPEFKGSKKELLKTLRARRVREKRVFTGLEELLKKLEVPSLSAKKCFLFYSFADLASVKDFVKAFNDRVKAICIKDSFHTDIVTSKEVLLHLKSLFSRG